MLESRPGRVGVGPGQVGHRPGRADQPRAVLDRVRQRGHRTLRGAEGRHRPAGGAAVVGRDDQTAPPTPRPPGRWRAPARWPGRPPTVALPRYGGFTGDPSPAEVERLFYLDDADRDLTARRRSDSHRLGVRGAA